MMLQCGAVCYSVVQRAAECVAVCCFGFCEAGRVALCCCSVLQCVAACCMVRCSVLLWILRDGYYCGV